jgi:hypothetical protein
MPYGADHVADKGGHELHRLSKLYDFPDFVKKASMEQTFQPTNIAITTYADPVRKQFPCHNAASTWLSALYFAEKKAEFHPKDQVRIKAQLDGYVRYWKIKEAVDALEARHSVLHKTAEDHLPDSAFAYVRVGANSQKQRHLPMRNGLEVKQAADWLYVYRDKLPFFQEDGGGRHQIALKILEKAAHFGANVVERLEFLEKQAGRGVCDPTEVVRVIQERAFLTVNEPFRKDIIKLAMLIKDQPRQALHPQSLVKLATTLDQIDQTLGLRGKYTEKIPRPEDVIFRATFAKSASEMNDMCALTNGVIYKKADFTKIPLSGLSAIFGREFADDVKAGLDKVDQEKLAEIASTLPRGDADLFGKLAAEVGVYPHLTKAASAPIGFRPEALKELAKLYRGVF